MLHVFLILTARSPQLPVSVRATIIFRPSGSFWCTIKSRIPTARLASRMWSSVIPMPGHRAFCTSGRNLQLTPGLRFDQYNFNVENSVTADSGLINSGIVSPKFTAAYSLSSYQQLYADWGESYHSNDARGITDTLDPQTWAPYSALGQPVLQDSGRWSARLAWQVRLPLLAGRFEQHALALAIAPQLRVTLRWRCRRHVRGRSNNEAWHRVRELLPSAAVANLRCGHRYIECALPQRSRQPWDLCPRVDKRSYRSGGHRRQVGLRCERKIAILRPPHT